MYQTGKTGKAYLYSRGANFEIGRDSGYRNDVFRDFPDHHHANRGLVPRAAPQQPTSKSFYFIIQQPSHHSMVRPHRVAYITGQGPPQVDNRPPPIIFCKIAPKSHSRDPAYCCLSDQNPVRRKTQHILMFCTSRGLQHRGVC